MGKPSIPCTIVSALILGAAAAAQPLEISGSVQSANGDPLAATTVELRSLLPVHERARRQLAGEPEPAAVKRTRTDRDGEYRLDAVAGFWTLVVRHRDHLPAAHDLSPLLVSRRLGDLRLLRRSELAARLADDEGRPIAGVALWVGGWSKGWRESVKAGWRSLERMARTDGAGLAALPCASDETVTIAALDRGRFLYREEPCSAGLVALAHGAPLRDARLVHDDGAPVAAYGFLRWPFLAFGASDEAGVVRGPFAEPEAVPVAFADSLGFYGRHRWQAPADGGEDTSDDLPRLRLAPSVIFRGTAVDAFDGSPVDGAWLWGGGALFFKSLERGAFEVRLPVGGQPGVRGGRQSATVYLGGPGYLTIAHRSPPAGADSAVVMLTPAMTLTGRVIDAGGDAIAGARIENRKTHTAFGRRLSELQGGGRWQLDAVAATSAGDGSFELRRLPPLRPFEVRVASPGYAAAYEPVPSLEPGVAVEELVIVLERGISGFGLVVNEREMPIAGAEVALLPTLTGAAAEQSYEVKENYRATTGAGGRFTLHDLPAGRYYLSARAAGFPELLVPGIEVAADPSGARPVDLGTLVLKPGIELAGRVVDAEGEPVAAAELSLRNADGEQLVVQRADSAWFASTTSRANGSFHLAGLPRDSRLVLLAMAGGYLPREQAVTTGSDDQRLDVELSRGARLAGVVLDPAGRPAAGARVDVTADPDQQRMSTSTSRTALTDAEGRFEVLGLRPGGYTIDARLDAAASRPVRRRVPAEGLSGLYLELRRRAALEVTVLDAGGAPVPEALVMAVARTAVAEGERRSGMQTTDTRGLAVIQPLGTGVYLLTARHPDHGTVKARAEVAAAGKQPFELRFTSHDEDTLEVSGRVVDASGLPVSGARLWLDRGPTVRKVRPKILSGGDGGFTLRAPPGSYRLGCSHRDFATYLGARFTLAEDGLSGVVVELSKGASVTGRVTGLELEDLARLVVMARGPLVEAEGSAVFGQRYGTVDFEGGLRVEGLAAGQWSIRAVLLNPTLSASEEIEVTGADAAGGEVRVDLHFQAGHRLTGSVLGAGGPLAGATVSLSCAAELRGRTFTGDDGRFAFDHLPGGRCRLSAVDPDSGRAGEQRVEIASDTDVVLEIKPPL